MTWFLAEIKYTQSTSYTGVDQLQLVIQDSEGAYSDVITINIVMMEMPCLHGGECLGKFHGCTEMFYHKIDNPYVCGTYHIVVVFL